MYKYNKEKQINNNKIYVLYEEVFPTCENAYTEIIGVYKNKEKAIQETKKIIKDNLENYDFVEDNESEENLKRIFLNIQENWDYYIEYHIIEKNIIN